MTASSVAGSSGSSVTTARIRRTGGGAQEHGNEAKGLAGADPQGLGRSCEPGASADGEPGEDYRSEPGADRARADVREMEGLLERVRASIAKIARKLAVYVRAERTR